MSPVRAYIGLGSNLEDPAGQIARALEALDAVSGTRMVAHSRLYRNPPLGPADQPDFVNAVAALDTTLEPHALLDALQSIERAQGRERGSTRWGPRTLDLDLLSYGDRTIDDERLRVPHPEMSRRAFVVHPLEEIAPGLVVPGLGAIATLARRLPAGGLVEVAAG